MMAHATLAGPMPRKDTSKSKVPYMAPCSLQVDYSQLSPMLCSYATSMHAHSNIASVLERMPRASHK